VAGKGYIKMVRRGHYAFSGLEISESVLFMIANKIYTPSYVSMETAFSHYHLIPEAVYGISSVASRKTNHFQTNYGEFIYRHIKPQLMFGYKLNSYQGHTFKIAEMEKALLDILNPRMDKEGGFASLRFNSTEFNAQADKKASKLSHCFRQQEAGETI
jgi:predicted transcriptional regulator of viral defense system